MLLQLQLLLQLLLLLYLLLLHRFYVSVDAFASSVIDNIDACDDRLLHMIEGWRKDECDGRTKLDYYCMLMLLLADAFSSLLDDVIVVCAMFIATTDFVALHDDVVLVFC